MLLFRYSKRRNNLVKKDPLKRVMYKIIKKNENLIRKILKNISNITKIRNKCPYCNISSVFGDLNGRSQVSCPNCRSLERHRFFYFVYENEIMSKTQEIKMLHYAPEFCVSNLFTSKDNIQYFSIDLNPERYKSIPNVIKMDATNLEFEDESFDIIISNHVLEHIPDDRKVLQEMYRVLKKGGVVFISVAMNHTKETDEDPEVKTPEERLKRYRHVGHYRLYGYDFAYKLKEAGFKSEYITAKDILSMDKILKYRTSDLPVYKCTKL